MLGDPRYTDQLLTLMVEVARIEDFDHLARLEDGPDKVQRAQRAVARLKPYTDSYEEVVRERTQARERDRGRETYSRGRASADA